ncbi:MAG TPA: class I SAM-dependent methyltransferase [Chloroflexota bacterium]
MSGDPAGDFYRARPDLYDLMHEDQVEDIEFVRHSVAMLPDGARVLELGCGTGRLLRPILEDGAVAVGLDREPAMLRVAASKLGMFGERLGLLEGEMTRFEAPGEPFDLALIGLNTFMHLLTMRNQMSCLECIHRHLRPGGTLLIDLANPHSVLRDTQQGMTQHRFTKLGSRDADTLTTLWSATMFNLTKQLAHTTLLFDEVDNRTGLFHRTSADIVLRLTYRYELEHLLARTGFTTRALYGDYESSPYEDDSERLICSCAAFA